MRSRDCRLLALPLVIALTTAPTLKAGAQDETWPGVRGTLYESPSFGWILLAPTPDWEFAGAASQDGVDSVHLVANTGDGSEDYFFSYLDDGRGVEGCVHDLVDSLAASFEGDPLQGWREPEVEFTPASPAPTDLPGAQASAYARVVRSLGDGLDVMAYLACEKLDDDPLIIADALLRTERDLEGNVEAPLLTPLWPGVGHTGRPRAAGDGGAAAGEGVVRFLYRNWDGPPAGAVFPFNCNDQESFARPSAPPPPDRGWFACDGKIVNVDVMPATIDLDQLRIGCLNPADDPTVCPVDPVVPSKFEVLQGPPGAEGSIVTLQPGEAIDVVLWYALPGGEAPPHILYTEPRLPRPVLAGFSFFTEGTGSRPIVRIGR